MAVRDAVEAQIAKFPLDLRESGLAAGVIAMAAELDAAGNSATSKSMCFKAMQDGLRELRDLAPPDEAEDGVDELAARRKARLAGVTEAADQSRT